MLTLHAGTVARIMAAVIVFLVLASISIQVFVALSGRTMLLGVLDFLDVDAEMNLPTWYSSAGLLFAAAVLAMIAVMERAGRWWLHWFGLSGIFLALSADEIAAIHERLIVPTRKLLGMSSGVMYFSWIVPAVAVLVVLGVVYAQWFFTLPRRTRKFAALSAFLFIGGGIVMEMPGGLVASQAGKQTPLFIVLSTLEETLEMCGVAVWIYTLLDYAAARGYEVGIRFGYSSAVNVIGYPSVARAGLQAGDERVAGNESTSIAGPLMNREELRRA